MSNFAQLCTKVFQFIREAEYVPTTDSTFPSPPSNSQFPLYLLKNDINDALSIFISQAGFPPNLTDKYLVAPVLPQTDILLPVDALELTRLEYQITGQGPIVLRQKTFDEFDAITAQGYNLVDTGLPECFREPYGAPPFIRLYPTPTPGNAGMASGSFVLGGVPITGQTVALTLINGVTTVNVGPYVVLATDTLASIAVALSGLVNASAAVTGGGAFIRTTSATVPQTNAGSLEVVASAAGVAGNAITISGAVGNPTLGGLTITPHAATVLSGGGVNDNFIWYYSSAGVTLSAATDIPNVPVVFHEAPSCYVASRYWRIKNDTEQSDLYMKDFERHVKLAKAYSDNMKRGEQASIEDAEDTEGGDNLFGPY